MTGGGQPPTADVQDDEPKAMVITDAAGREHKIPGELRYPGEKSKTHRTWAAYAIAYHRRYGVWPIWNASIAGRVSQFIDRVGKDLAPKVAYHYVAKVEDGNVAKDMHSVAILLAGAEKWATQLRAGIQTPAHLPQANKQTALEERNRAVGDAWVAKMMAAQQQGA